MTTLKLLVAEIRYRKLNFVLSLLAVIIAVSLFVAGPILVDGYGRQTEAQLVKLEDETRKLMKNMGFNLMIVHKDTDMTDFWAEDFAKYDMPQEYVERLANAPSLTLVTHLVATLQKRIEWHGRKVLLQGYLPETPQSHQPQTKFAKKMAQLAQQRRPMGDEITPGTVRLGYELRGDYKVGDTVEILGKKLTVAKIMPEKGSKDDIAVAVHLSDAQDILGLPGKINQIMALECHCAEAALPIIRRQIAEILPEARVTEFQTIALARAEQRDQVAKSRAEVQDTLGTLVGVVTPIIVLACAVWVGLLALANVRERRAEIGLFRALGKGSGMIASLFLGKAVLLGLAGAAVGFVLGSWLAAWLGVEALDVSRGYFGVHVDVLLFAVIGAPLLSALASYLPTLSALMQDPAVVLREL